MQHPNYNASNIRLEQRKHFEQTLKHLNMLHALKHLQHMQHVQHPPIYFCNIHVKQLQHTSKTSETLETYACNIRFHCNISLLRSRIAAAITFWWETTVLAAPWHARGTVRSNGGTARRWRERGAGRSAALDGGAARREMGCTAGKTVASEQRAHAQLHVMGEHGSEIF